jgi:predicted membrane protein
MRAAAGDLGRRMLAILVLIVAAWILLKIVIGIVAGVATVIVAVIAIFAVVWAIRVL